MSTAPSTTSWPRRPAPEGAGLRGAPRRPGRRRRPVGHRRRPLPADRMPLGLLRHLRRSCRHRWHVGPLPLPGHPLGLGHVHPRLLVPSVGRREGHRRRGLHPAVHQGHRGGVRDRPAHPVQPPHHGGRLVHRGRVLAHHRRAGGHRRDGRAHRRLHLLLQRLLPLRPRVRARVRGPRAVCRADHPPPGLAGGPRLRRQARRGHRQRRDRGHPHPVVGRDGRSRHDAPALAGLHRLGAGQEPADVRAQDRPPGPVGRHDHALGHGRRHAGDLLHQQAPPGDGEAGAAARPRPPAPQGLRHRHALHPVVQPVGPAAVRGPQRRPLQGHPGRLRLRRHGPHPRDHRDGDPAAVRRGAGRRHHRVGHGPRAALHRRDRRDGGRREGQRARPAHLQGDDARRRAEHGPGHRLHERVVDAEVRPHLRLRHQAGQPPARDGPAPVHAGEQRCVGHGRTAPRPQLRLHHALGGQVPQAGVPVPVAGAPEATCGTTGR